MGGSQSQLERDLATEFPDFPENERLFGMENFGSTCYANSVLQALYFCKPFRDKILESYRNVVESIDTRSESSASSKGEKGETASMHTVAEVSQEHLLFAIGELFNTISNHKKRTGAVSPKGFIRVLMNENAIYRSAMHQDAHEFLNFVLNRIVELLQMQNRVQIHSDGDGDGEGNGKNSNNNSSSENDSKTWVHSLFNGVLSNETRCLRCENVTSQSEPFLDLSIDIEKDCSVSSCLRQFSASERLAGDDKFHCDVCCSQQEAERSMKIKALPQVLALHLKRFKYIERIGRFSKLSHCVVFPFELKITNLSDDSESFDCKYHLFAVVVHLGSGPNHGHYVSFVKTHGAWLRFDDDRVTLSDEASVRKCCGGVREDGVNTAIGYILFYENMKS